MGNCISNINICNGYFDNNTNTNNKRHSKSIEVYLERNDKEKNQIFLHQEHEECLAIKTYGKNINIADPNKLSKYFEIYEKNNLLNISKIQRFFRKFRIRINKNLNINYPEKNKNEDFKRNHPEENIKIKTKINKEMNKAKETNKNSKI